MTQDQDRHVGAEIEVRMSMVKFLSLFALGGVLIPLTFQVIWWLGNKYHVMNLRLGLYTENIMLILWPSSIMMLPVHNYGTLYYIAISISIAVNVVFYIVIGLVIWYGVKYNYVYIFALCGVLVVLWWRLLTL